MFRFLLCPFLVACGSSESMAPTWDAALDDAGKPIVPPPSLVPVVLDCVDFTRDVHHAATDGSHDITINSYATVTLAPGADFVLSVCDAPVAPSCSGGDQCTGELQPSATQICDVQRGGGRFFDGKLTVLCGSRSERRNAGGTLLSSTQTTFEASLSVFQ